MRKILLQKKTGFDIINPNREVVIRDVRGRIFYSTESLLPRTKNFNLPSNIPLFVEKGHFRDRKYPVKYNLVSLPKRERYSKPDPSKFKVIYKYNPNTCTINWRKKQITFDDSILELAIPYQTFILYHEFGHKYYSTEEHADRYARNCMIKRGFNPSQILLAPYYTLNENNNYRKELIAASF